MSTFLEGFRPLRMLIDNISQSVKTVNEGIATWFAKTGTQIPYAVQQMQLDDIAQLKEDKVADKSLAKGMTAPDFKLLNQNGEAVSLSERLKQGPVILTFYRGRWCPYCNIELRALQRTLDEFKSLGASLLAISPQTVEQTREFAGEAPLTFDALSDENNTVAAAYGLVYKVNTHASNMFNAFGFQLNDFNTGGGNELPLPATYVVDQSGTIAYSFVDPDYTKRAEPAELISVIKGLKL